MNRCVSPNVYDDINYVVVSTDYEYNLLFDKDLTNLINFNINNKCKCLFACVGDNIYMANHLNNV